MTPNALDSEPVGPIMSLQLVRSQTISSRPNPERMTKYASRNCGIKRPVRQCLDLVCAGPKWLLTDKLPPKQSNQRTLCRIQFPANWDPHCCGKFQRSPIPKRTRLQNNCTRCLLWPRASCIFPPSSGSFASVCSRSSPRPQHQKPGVLPWVWTEIPPFRRLTRGFPLVSSRVP